MMWIKIDKKVNWLRELRKRKEEVRKGRVYVSSPEEAPEGATLYRGKRGGLYYLSEEVKMKRIKEHEEKVVEAKSLNFNVENAEHLRLFKECRKVREGKKVMFEKLRDEMFDFSRKYDAFSFSRRLKSGISATLKILKKRKQGEKYDVEDIWDWMGFRMEFESLREMYVAIEKMKRKYKVVAEDDYFNNPKGIYISYHLILDVDGEKVEVQFRLKGLNVMYEVAHVLLYKDGRLGEEQRKRVEEIYKKLVKEFKEYRRLHLEDKIDELLEHIPNPYMRSWIRRMKEEIKR